MSARAIRTVAVLFGLSLMLTACDPSEVMRLVSDQLVEQQAAAPDDPGQDDTDATDDADADADTDAAAAADVDADTATSNDKAADADAEVGKTEDREFQCRRRGTPKRDADTKADTKKDDSAADQPADTADTATDTDTEADRPKKKRRRGGDRSPAKAHASNDAPDDDAPADDAPGDAGSSAGVSDIERRIFDTLNATRRQAGLQALTLRADISDGARGWSCEMARSGNFRHADLRTAGVNGENIAWGYRTAADVHEGWMNSDGHRRNRLRANWTEYGIGVCTDDAGRRYYTERFR